MFMTKKAFLKLVLAIIIIITTAKENCFANVYAFSSSTISHVCKGGRKLYFLRDCVIELGVTRFLMASSSHFFYF